MEAIALFFSKFSEELIGAQIALLSLCLTLAFYWMLVRKKKRESAEWVPAAHVRAYLDRIRADERETRLRLFGEDSGAVPGSAGTVNTITVTDPNMQREVDALRAQLASADQRAMEFDRMMNGLRAEKTALEQKLKDAQSQAAAGGAAGAPSPAMQKELEDLRAKLQEYEVIEDDLANLKKFQKENEQLKQRLEQLEKGGGAAPQLSVVQGGAAAAPEPAPAAPAPEPTAAAPAPAAEPSAPAAEANTNVLQAPSADAAPAAAPEKSAKQKEEELLSEFEKMLAS